MLERLSLRELIRFFFSGIVTLLGIAANTTVTVTSAVEWLRANDWATAFSPAALVAVATLLLGYITFTLYRTVIYDWGILRLKGLLARPAGGRRLWYDYRALIQDEMSQGHKRRLTTLEAERLYRIVRGAVAADYYKETAPDITTGLHFLYLSSTIAIVAALCSQRWLLLGIALVGFCVSLASDIHHERDELLLFLNNRTALREALGRLIPNPLWPEES